MNTTKSLAVILALLAIVIVPSDAQSAPQVRQQQPQSRTDHILYSIPKGWKRAEKDKYTALEAPTAAGKMVEIRIYPAKALTGTLDAAAAAEIENYKKNYSNVQTTPVNATRHANGFDMIITGVSRTIPDAAIYDALCFVRAGDQVQQIEFETNDFQLYESHKMAFDGFLRGVRLTDSIVLAKGNPPLTQATVDTVTDFLEWLMEVPYTEEQKQMIADNILDSWKKNDRGDIEGTMEVLKLRAQLSEMTPEQKALARQAAQPELIKAARKETDAVAKMIVQVYDAAHKPIAPGDPPLTRQGSDAMLEVLFFMASQVQGGDAAVLVQPRPTQEMKDQWAKNLAANYGKADAAARTNIAKMPMTWSAIRMLWPELPEADKAQARAQWAQSNEVKQIAEVLSKMRPPQTAPAGTGDGNGYFAEGKNVVHVDGQLRYVVFNMSSEAEAKARAVEMNKGRDNLINPGSKDSMEAAELMANRTRDYQFTKSMLNMGYNNTIIQMAAISGNQWRYK